MIVSKFGLTGDQIKIIHEWEYNENKKLQYLTNGNSSDAIYTGAIGGCLTYSFTPTNLGTVVKIHHALTGNIIDVTEYELW